MALGQLQLPLYVLTGFLGSGKTSLLRVLLDDPDFSDTAVLINEFGDIGLDHELVETVDEDTVVLKGGCICCTVREDLAASIRHLVDLRRDGNVKQFDRLIVETSGLADPVPVLFTLRSDPRITQLFVLRGAITAIDAVAGLRTLSKYTESVRQVIYANRVVITKCDVAGPEQIEEIEKTIREINPSASVRYSDARGVSPESFLGELEYDPSPSSDAAMDWLGAQESGDKILSDSQSVVEHGNSSHVFRYRTFSWEVDGEIDWTVFGVWLTMLLHAHGDRVLRVKGILNISESDAPVAVHGVQHVVHPPVHMKRWSTERKPSRIVFVVQDLSPEVIWDSFQAFERFGALEVRNKIAVELPAGAGRMVGGRPRRRPTAPAWIKG